MGRLFKYLFLFNVFLYLSSANNWQLSYMENNLAKCVIHLVIDENIPFTRNVRISVQTESVLSKFIAGDIIETARMKQNNINIVYELLQVSGKTFTYDIHTRLIIVDSFNSFRDLLKIQRKNSFDIHGIRQDYNIILTNYQEGTNTIEKILELCLQSYIVNVNVLVEDSEGLITIYTYFPFTEVSCRKSTPIVYNRFVEGKFQWNRPVFPEKTKNLWLCPVKAVLWHKPPFVFLESDKELSGIDGNFLIFLSKAMNFTLDIYESPGGLGEVLPNGTMRGAFKILQDGEGDLTVGGTICSNVRRSYLACTRSYYTTAVEMIVKKPDPYSSLEILLFPFDSQMWLTFFLFFVINLTIRSLRKKITNSFGRRKIYSARLQVISWLLSIFIIRSSYEGSIFKFLHNQPIRRAPQSFEEALQDGYKFVAKSTYFPFIKHIPNLVDKLILTEVSLSKLFDEFDKYNGKYGFINLDNYLTVIANDSTRYQHYAQVREPILHHIVCVYLPKFSFFTKELNNQIQMMINHGHMDKIYDISVTDKLRKIKAMHGSIVHTIPGNFGREN
ncbi:uncharacterized protein LOC129919315 [Episyrphus balteatus]|uniref:uncharacterized protein LOC129919315 n=1 Tax=Episyrphus balteatus TaxID=286459 RepID=UPI0024852465|nr:uncharacterized protein LOC129919315 [Episyrphus balteatus]